MYSWLNVVFSFRWGISFIYPKYLQKLSFFAFGRIRIMIELTSFQFCFVLTDDFLAK